MDKIFTGFYDDLHQPIYVGDCLHCKYGYDVIVCQDETGFYGKLVCESTHSCANIPYAINDGKDYIKKNYNTIEI